MAAWAPALTSNPFRKTPGKGIHFFVPRVPMRALEWSHTGSDALGALPLTTHYCGGHDVPSGQDQVTCPLLAEAHGPGVGLGSFSRKNWAVVAKEERKDAVQAMPVANR